MDLGGKQKGWAGGVSWGRKRKERTRGTNAVGKKPCRRWRAADSRSRKDWRGRRETLSQRREGGIEEERKDQETHRNSKGLNRAHVDEDEIAVGPGHGGGEDGEEEGSRRGLRQWTSSINGGGRKRTNKTTERKTESRVSFIERGLMRRGERRTN